MQHARAVLVVGVLTVAGCSAGSGSSDAEPTSNPSRSPLPAIMVEDVTADRSVALDSFIPSDLPTLLWFWAPH